MRSKGNQRAKSLNGQDELRVVDRSLFVFVSIYINLSGELKPLYLIDRSKHDVSVYMTKNDGYLSGYQVSNSASVNRTTIIAAILLIF